MRKVLLSLAFLATVVGITPAQADHHDKGGEVAGNELLFGANAGSVDFDFSGTTYIQIPVTVGYFRGMGPGMQVGIKGGFNINTSGVFSASTWTAQPWIQFNMGKFEEAIFVGAGIGLQNLGTSGGYLQVPISAQVGKRMEVAHGLSYRPNLELTKVLDNSHITWKANFLAFSYIW